MPRKVKKPPPFRIVDECEHASFTFEPSAAADEKGFCWPSQQQRANAADSSLTYALCTFPGPLVLPEDDLAIYPKHRTQTVKEWTQVMKSNRMIQPQRKTIYVIPPPECPPELSMVQSWAFPGSRRGSGARGGPNVTFDVEAVADYVAAFYHGAPVRLLPKDTLKFALWAEDDHETIKQLKSGTSKNPLPVGLVDAKNGKTRIRTRPTLDGKFKRQLSVNDVLDVLIRTLPEDAYAVVMLLHHDLYEDEEDLFIAGRAYGGSRVCVVSTARYNPALDAVLELDTPHAWPLSHCVEFVDGFDLDKNIARPFKNHDLSALQGGDGAEAGIEIGTDIEVESPMGAAINAVRRPRGALRKSNKESPASRWLGRVCKTVSHELGHCFGMDHCVYYACCMQGSASLYEDARQPPYLCPVDLQKVLRALGVTMEQPHYEAMLKFCHRHSEVELFAAYASWLRVRLDQLTGVLPR